jgi:glycosyltransferase involved in cell wall biosynthesis
MNDLLRNRTILQVTPALNAGGVERTTIEIAQAIVREGGRALVASAGGRLEGALADVGGELIRLAMDAKDWRLITHVGTLARLIRAEGVDLVHARSRAPAWSAYGAARLAKVPFVTTYHGIYNARSGLKRFYNGVMARGDVVIANSHYTADHIRATYQLSDDRLVTIPRGVDLSRFDRAKVDADKRTAMRARWGLTGPDHAIVLPGRLTSWKGQRIAIEAFARAKLSNQARLVLVGDAQGRDGYVDELRGLIKALGLEEHALIHGHEDDMVTVYAASDLVLSASTDPEAFGRVAIEAQAMGVPVIASDHGGARETVEPATGGARVIPGDPDALAAALNLHFSIDQASLAAMSQRVAERAARIYSVKQMQTDTISVYSELIGEK